MSITTAHFTRRPLHDYTPDQPLTFHGMRIGRDGNVYAACSPMTHGRTNPNREVRIGTIEKIGRTWVARTDSGMPFEGARQQDAATALYTFIEAQL